MELTVTFICIVALMWYIWRKQHLSAFKKLGIPGPEPRLFFGNLLELYYKGPVKCHEEWVKKYGRVLGYYYGMKPVLLVADPSLLKNIFIKDFSKFINREPFSPLYKYNPHDKYEQSLLSIEGKKWKDTRSVLTPTFTTAKMKQMVDNMNPLIDSMVYLLKERSERGEVFDIYDTYKRVTFDIITKTAFGLRADDKTNSKSKLLKASRIIFRTNYKDPFYFLALCFPYLSWICRKVRLIISIILNEGVAPKFLFHNLLLQVLQHRKENPQESNSDLLQLMIEAKIFTDSKEVDVKDLETGNEESEAKCTKEDDTNRRYRKMEDYDIVSNAFAVLLAGYETTSTSLSFTTYLLAKHPEIQEKLHGEIREMMQNCQNLEYTSVHKLQYLDKILNESLRIHPPAYLFTNRFAIEDVEYGDLKIPKGMLVQAPVYLLHHDPELWEDPEKFDPERFNDKQNTNGITYMPFGAGPRNCIGLRFAQLVAKLIVAHLIYNFNVTPAECQKDHFDTIFRIRNIVPKNGVQVKLQLRKQDVN